MQEGKEYGVDITVLARHYTDFSPEKLKEIYDRAGLKIGAGSPLMYWDM